MTGDSTIEPTPTISRTALEVRDLQIVYRSASRISFKNRNRRRDVMALSEVNLSMAEGEIMAVVGPSGCGKSTLLAAVAGLLPPTRGSIRVLGEQVSEPTPRCSLMFQQYALFPWKTVRGNIELPLTASKKPEGDRTRTVDELLAEVDLKDKEAAYPEQLSGGQRQRVAFARALAQSPALMLLDEPFAALDGSTQIEMRDLLLRVFNRRTGTSVLLVTHDAEEAAFLANRVLIMSKGPGRIIRELHVPLPRERDYRITMLPEFQSLKWEILDTLRSLMGRQPTHREAKP